MDQHHSSTVAAVAYDVFNGDADGICALHQMRLHAPAYTALVTGVKRDIELLRKVPSHACAGASVLVLDISLDANAGELRRVLDAGARVEYFDHHSADQAFLHPALRLHCNAAPDVCTSILVDRHLGGRYRRWAVTAAFGDNLEPEARQLAQSLALDDAATAALAQLGQAINYNAYGECVEDLHIAPAALYRELSGYEDPFDFIAASDAYRGLLDGYRADCGLLRELRPYWEEPGGAIYVLPAAPWSRRISGVLANSLAARRDGSSFAVLNERTDGSYLVSVRSGAPALYSACGLCQQFEGGGGRVAAAGINSLPQGELGRFMDRFRHYFGLSAAPAGDIGHAC
ncbi:hypothetical protein [Duganella sp. LjRoot269]|jgi:hypothetical protein|uniref:hypothetical protein n=1 Tax=Duganella sp. LjRoot269 TaxID=3342305 RepID=UPI003ECF6EDE